MVGLLVIDDVQYVFPIYYFPVQKFYVMVLPSALMVIFIQRENYLPKYSLRKPEKTYGPIRSVTPTQ